MENRSPLGETLVDISHEIIDRMRRKPSTTAFHKEGFIALAVLLGCVVRLKNLAESEKAIRTLLQEWLDNVVSEELYEELARVNGAVVRDEDEEEGNA